MAWYGWLIVVAVVAVATGIIVWLVARKQSGGQAMVEAERSKATRLAEEVQAERSARDRIAAELQRFADENRKLQAWYAEQKDHIAKEAQDEFAKLASDPAELDRRLGALLGTGSKPT